MSERQFKIFTFILVGGMMIGVYSMQIPATILLSVLTFLGGGMNHLVMAANGQKMPVLIRDGEHMESKLLSATYCRLTSTTRLPWLADVIKIEPKIVNRVFGWNFFAYASIGDLIQFAATPVALWIFVASFVKLVTAFV